MTPDSSIELNRLPFLSIPAELQICVCIDGELSRLYEIASGHIRITRNEN